MDTVLLLSAIVLTQIPGLVIRLIPYYRRLTPSRRKTLFLLYCGYLIVQCCAFGVLIPRLNMTLNFFKFLTFFGNIALFACNCIVLPNIFQQLFLTWMSAILLQLLYTPAGVCLNLMKGPLTIGGQCLIFSFFYLAVFFLLLYPLCHLFAPSVHALLSLGDNYRWNISWLIPMGLFFANFSLTLGESWIDPRQIAGRLFTAMAAFFTFRTVTLELYEYASKDELDHRTDLLKLQETAMNDRMRAVEESNRQLSILRHDMRHRINLLDGMAESGDLAAIQNILNEWNSSLDQTAVVDVCGHPVLNSVISAYLSAAQKKGIDMSVQVDFPADLPIDPVPLAVALSNALENAISASEAQSGEKRIELTSRCARGQIAVMVRNRFDGTILFDEEGLPVSEKKGHGIGTRSIAAFARRSNAFFSCSLEEGWFTLRLMFGAEGEENVLEASGVPAGRKDRQP